MPVHLKRSRRWRSKQQVNPQIDVEVIRHPESENEFHSRYDDVYNKNAYNNHDMIGGNDSHDLAIQKKVEKSLNISDGIRGAGKEIPTCERARHLVYTEANERSPSSNGNGFHPPHSIGRPTFSDLHSATPASEPSERPKLKLLPRSKPIENLEPPMEDKQVGWYLLGLHSKLYDNNVRFMLYPCFFSDL